MAKPRKSWEPKYLFGGNKSSWALPKPLGENTSPYFVKTKPKPRRKKK